MYLKQADDPPYLSVGTAVSAKYKGAFCEAKVSKVVRIVKCKVTFKMGLGIATVSDENIRGSLRVGHTVMAKHPEKKELLEATIGKIQDCSQYTVVFDDGDITTLRRTALCLKSGRHFNESETLDQLPLTHPEHFGNPVVGGRRGRRNRQLEDDSSEGEAEEENEPDLEGYSTDIGRVVSVETTDKKRGKDNWFPGLVVIPSAQPTGRINIKDEYLIRSFKDGRYYTVPKKEVSEFSRELGERAESAVLTEAVAKTLKYLDLNELPAHWERNSLFNMQPLDTDSEENCTDTSDEGPTEEKDLFVAQLYKFMDEAGTPLNKSPLIANRDVDLHRLFRVVHKMGGCNRVTNQNKWRAVGARLKLPANQITFNQVKSVYKKCLLSYESFYRTLGVTMLNHTRSTKKNRGRSLIRDKDRATPVQVSSSPKQEEEEKKEEEKVVMEVKKVVKQPVVRPVTPVKEEKKCVEKKFVEPSDSGSSSSECAESLPSTSVGRPKRVDKLKEKKTPVKLLEKVQKEPVEEERQQTRSKSLAPKKETSIERKKDVKALKIVKKPPNEEGKRGRKRVSPVERPEEPPSPTVGVGDKLKVYYGPTHESKVTYEAKVIEIDKDGAGPVYRVHYTGWNTRYDEWINPARIAENLSAATKAKKLRQGGGPGRAKVGKRGRGMSMTGRSTAEAPRSTTPSSVTSSSSRTKSPATPATRSSSRMRRVESTRKTRRASAQTDNSNHSETETEASDSECEMARTRSGTRSEEPELRTYKKRPKVQTRPNLDGEESDSTIKSAKRLKKVKKLAEDSDEDEEEEVGLGEPTKGRDYDLNQIRSELKGFNKVKTPVETAEKEALDSSDDSTNTTVKIEPIEEEKKELEKASSSEDIYEFKEPEPLEFESRSKIIDEKSCKKRIPRLFDDLEKSPKRKTVKSPKGDKISPDEKKLSKTPRKSDDEEDEEEKKVDLFDKLVESPSFNLVKSNAELGKEVKTKVAKNLDALKFFGDFPDPSDEFNRSDLSDSETQAVFAPKTEPEPSTSVEKLEAEFSTKSDENKKEDEFDSIRESITRAIQRTPSTDDYENSSDDDLILTQSVSNYMNKKRDIETVILLSPTKKVESIVDDVKSEVKEELEVTNQPQEGPSFLKTIAVVKPKVEESKSALKIADSILQKFSSIKNKTVDNEETIILGEVEKDIKPLEEISKTIELKLKPSESEKKSVIVSNKPELIVPSIIDGNKKKRKVMSKAYIEDSDTDTTDSEQLVIARSDDDSQQTNSLDKPDKESDSNLTNPPLGGATDESDEVPPTIEPTRNFKFDAIDEKTEEVIEKMEEVEEKEEEVKEEEPDSQLHSLLLCEETIPRSPAPVGDGGQADVKPKTKKSVLEMPFASAPGSSNNKNMLLNNDHKAVVVKPVAEPQVVAGGGQDANAVLDNTPPTTPESSISNLSPTREELSPNTAENESCKSNDAEPEFIRKRRSSSINKVPNYSEDDSQMTNDATSLKRPKEEAAPASCRKRRKSARTEETPAKRGRKPLNRSRHNSDSDDTSEHSASGAAASLLAVYQERTSKSPRPSKYNFFVEFDPSLNSSQRISVLQQKLSELRKTYAEVKTELAAVERRRKKIRRREREALKASKQELVCG